MTARVLDFVAAKAARDAARAAQVQARHIPVDVNHVHLALNEDDLLDVTTQTVDGREVRWTLDERRQEWLRLTLNGAAKRRDKLRTANLFALAGPAAMPAPVPTAPQRRPLCKLTPEGWNGSPRKSGCARHRGHAGDCRNGEGRTYPKVCQHFGMIGLTGPIEPTCPSCGADLGPCHDPHPLGST